MYTDPDINYRFNVFEELGFSALKGYSLAYYEKTDVNGKLLSILYHDCTQFYCFRDQEEYINYFNGPDERKDDIVIYHNFDDLFIKDRYPNFIRSIVDNRKEMIKQEKHVRFSNYIHISKDETIYPMEKSLNQKLSYRLSYISNINGFVSFSNIF